MSTTPRAPIRIFRHLLFLLATALGALVAFGVLLGYRFSPENYQALPMVPDTVELAAFGAAAVAAVCGLVALIGNRDAWPRLAVGAFPVAGASLLILITRLFDAPIHLYHMLLFCLACGWTTWLWMKQVAFHWPPVRHSPAHPCLGLCRRPRHLAVPPSDLVPEQSGAGLCRLRRERPAHVQLDHQPTRTLPSRQSRQAAVLRPHRLWHCALPAALAALARSQADHPPRSGRGVRRRHSPLLHCQTRASVGNRCADGGAGVGLVSIYVTVRVQRVVRLPLGQHVPAVVLRCPRVLDQRARRAGRSSSPCGRC